MSDHQHLKKPIQNSKFLRIKSIYNKNLKFNNHLSDCLVVIILTVLFNFFYEWNENLINFSFALIAALVGFRIYSSIKSRSLKKKISESIPQFISLLIMSMGMGKSLRYAFQKILERQNSDVRVFYEEIFQKIFLLREQKSGFGVQQWDKLYEFLFELSLKSSHQLNSLRYFQAQELKRAQTLRRKNALMMPVWIQTIVMLLLFLFVQLWNAFSGGFAFHDFALVSAWYGIGIFWLIYQQQLRNRKV